LRPGMVSRDEDHSCIIRSLPIQPRSGEVTGCAHRSLRLPGPLFPRSFTAARSLDRRNFCGCPCLSAPHHAGPPDSDTFPTVE
jgi:hypothetical protein